jgi:hypothetical protein
MKWLKNFRKGLFTKSQFVVGVTLTMFTTSLVVYAVQNLLGLNVFIAGTPISSSDVNLNFSYINKMVQDTNQKFSVGVLNNQGFPTATNFSDDLSSVLPLDLETAFYDYSVGTLGRQLVNVGSFTVTESGLYDITLTGRVASPAGASGGIALYKNANHLVFLNVDNTGNFLNERKFLNSGDVIRVRAKKSNGPGLIYLDPSKTKIIFHKL